MGHIKRILSHAAERRLLSKHLCGDFGCGTWASIQSLIDRGMVAEDGDGLVVTARGREYCDTYHMDMPLSR